MICKNCYTENKDGVKFCIKCGNRLAEVKKEMDLDERPELQTERRKPIQSSEPEVHVSYGRGPLERSSITKKERKKWPVILTLVLLILFAGGGIGLKLYLEHAELEKKVEEARALESAEAYEEAIDIYREISAEKSSSTYLIKIKVLQELKESKDAFNAAVSAFNEGKFVEAILDWKKVSEKDAVRYKKSLERIVEAEEMMLSKAKDELKLADYAQAQQIIEEYMKIKPGDERARQLYREIFEAIEARNEAQQNVIAQEYQRMSQEELVRTESEMQKTAHNLIGTYQWITSEYANVRSQPVLDGNNLIGTLFKGDQVYVLDSEVEGIQRIWLKVRLPNSGIAWMSYNTMNNTIR